jgi:hypothetical protein
MQDAPDIDAASWELLEKYGIAKDVDAAGRASEFGSAAIDKGPVGRAIERLRDARQDRVGDLKPSLASEVLVNVADVLTRRGRSDDAS